MPTLERSGITRGERACHECRRMKVRCMREGDTPCRRCQHMQMECVIDPPTRRRKRATESQGGESGLQVDGEQPDDRRSAPLTKRTNTGTNGFEPVRSPLDLFTGYQPSGNSAIRHSPAESSTHRPTSISFQTGPSSGQSNPHLLPGGSSPPALPPDDPLASEHLVAPFRRLRSTADGRGESTANSPDRAFAELPSNPELSAVNVDDIIVPPSEAMLSVLLDSVKSRPSRKHDFADFAICPDSEARQLYAGFMEHCDKFVLVHDSHDTYESLRERSPAGLAAVVGIGALARDGPRKVSTAQKNAMQVAHAYILGTMFSRSRTLEDLQAAITIAVYHRNCWLLIGHAIRLATEMGVDQAFAKLAARGMGSAPNAAVEDRDLVIRTRLWLALYSHEAQMSFGDGQSPMIREMEGLSQCRRFLDHPLSTASDVRLVALVELLVLREPLHTRLSIPGSALRRQDLIAMLSKFRTDLHAWHTFYDALMRDRLGLEPSSYYRESLRTQREYASLFANSLLLRDVAQASDLLRLSDEEYILALSAARSAQICLDIVVNGHSYPKNVPFAIPHTRLSVAFAASFLLRTGKLFPDRLDPKATMQQVDGAITLLDECGASRLARALRFMRDRVHHGQGKENGLAAQIGADSTVSNIQEHDLAVVPDFDLAFGLNQDSGDTANFDFQFDNLFDPSKHPLSFGDTSLFQIETSAESSMPLSEAYPARDFNFLLSNLASFGQM